jgi:hypothetical protein
MPQHIIDTMTESIKVAGATLGGLTFVEVAERRRNGEGWPVYICAARLEGPEFTGEVAAWAMGADGGPVEALNDAACEYSPWGEAARPGSSAWKVREHIAGFPETAQAIDAARTA